MRTNHPPVERRPHGCGGGNRTHLMAAYETAVCPSSSSPHHIWSGKLESNQRPLDYRSSAQTTLSFSRSYYTQTMEPRARFELAFPDYRSGASPTMLTGPANSGANGANRTLIGCLPCNCSPVELHRLGARGGNRNPDLRVTSAALFHLSYSGTSKGNWSECGESNSVDRTGDPMPNQ